MDVYGAVGLMFLEHPVVIEVSVNRDGAGAVTMKSGLMVPVSRAAAAITILKTDPGASCA